MIPRHEPSHASAGLGLSWLRYLWCSVLWIQGREARAIHAGGGRAHEEHDEDRPQEATDCLAGEVLGANQVLELMWKRRSLPTWGSRLRWKVSGCL